MSGETFRKLRSASGVTITEMSRRTCQQLASIRALFRQVSRCKSSPMGLCHRFAAPSMGWQRRESTRAAPVRKSQLDRGRNRTDGA
jgi:hypothetical protein